MEEADAPPVVVVGLVGPLVVLFEVASHTQCHDLESTRVNVSSVVKDVIVPHDARHVEFTEQVLADVLPRDGSVGAPRMEVVAEQDPLQLSRS